PQQTCPLPGYLSVVEGAADLIWKCRHFRFWTLGRHRPGAARMPSFLGMPARLLRSVESVKMMHRPVAVADAKPIGCRDRRADPDLGLTHRGCHVLALGKAGCDG